MIRRQSSGGRAPSSLSPGNWSFSNIKSTSILLILTILLTTLNINGINGFNVDLATRIIQRGDPGSMFGYSVDLYKGNDGYGVLIGAPKAQTNQPGVTRGGAVYKCASDRISCSQMAFDYEGDNRALNGSVLLTIDSKSDQWFGAAVRSSDNGEKIVACAPRYTYYYSTFDKKDPVGTCFVSQNGQQKAQEFSPCRKEKKWGFHRLGYCMAGFSIALPERGEDFYLGAPGAFYWQGSLIQQKMSDPKFMDQTREGPEGDDDRYLGYAVATGDFDSDGDPDTAVGAPKGAHLKGLVCLFGADMVGIMNFTGTQEGAFFGSAIAAGDVDGDGYDDLIVGAPLYNIHDKDKGSLKTKYETGRVYVFFQTSANTFERRAELNGKTQWSRFGTSIAFVNDLNGDGYGDFIVGAPYDGPNKKGSVHVFMGMEGGVRDEPSQVIYAEDVQTRGIRRDPRRSPVKTDISSFGYSLAGGRDLDGNQFPDIVVGAYSSDRAIVLKSRPIVTLQGALQVEPKTLDLEDKSCNLQSGEKVACGKVTLCLKYTGKGVEGQVAVNALLQLDTDKGLANRTLLLTQDEGKSSTVVPFTLNQDSQPCETRYFYIKSTVRDKLTPVYIMANYSLVHQDPSKVEIKPVLDAYGTTTLKEKLDILKDCGSDNICVPDLQVTSSAQFCKKQGNTAFNCSTEPDNTFTIGKHKHMNVTVTVYNAGEDAYETQVFVNIPPGLDYDNYVKLTPDISGTCVAPVNYNSHDKTKPYNLTCDAGNPLPGGQSMVLTFQLSVPDTLAVAQKTMPLNFKVNSSNEELEATMADNKQTLGIPIAAKPQVSLFTSSEPDTINYDKADYNENVQWDYEAGEKVTHVYQVRNDGESDVLRTELDIYWPTQTRSGKHLLYLSKAPQVHTGIGECEVVGSVNPQHLGLSDVAKERRRRNVQESAAIGLAGVDGSKVVRKNRRQLDLPAETTGTANVFTKGFRRLLGKIKSWGDSVGQTGELRSLRVNCSELECVRIKCMLGVIPGGEYSMVKVESFLWVNTLIEEAFYDATISSAGIAKVVDLPYEVPELPTMADVARTYVNPKDPTKVARGVPWWLWLIAALAGLAFLLLIALLLWKLGFFKRKRPPREKALLSGAPDSEYYGYPSYGTHL